MYETAKLYVFSGTGNTLLIAETIATQLQRRGVVTQIHPISDLPELVPNKSTLVGLGFPVIMQTTFPFVLEAIHRLPQGQNSPIFMFDTMRALGTGIVSPLRKLVAERGYVPVGARQFPMPHNLVHAELGQVHRQAIITRSKQEAVHFADALIDRQAKWHQVPVVPELIAQLMSSSWLQQELARMGKAYQVSDTRCIRCGLCVRLCPVDNIALEEQPIFGDSCVQCLRCISYCPEKAITRAFPKPIYYQAMNRQAMIALEE